MWLSTCACSLTHSLDEFDSGAPGAHCDSDADCGAGLCRASAHVCSACPPEMRLVSFPDGDAFCIDRAETTQREYAQFLDSVERRPDIEFSQFCQSNSDYTPSDEGACQGSFRPETRGNKPVACVDACDAAAYCLSHGKRLCGGRGGSLILLPRFNDAAYDQWFFACAGLQNRLFPYGGDYAPDVCNIMRAGPEDVGSNARCTTPEGVLDLSGNVAEWTNACGIDDEASGIRCLVRGGSYGSAKPAVATCLFDRFQTPALPPLMPPMGDTLPSVGMRCCLD